MVGWRIVTAESEFRSVGMGSAPASGAFFRALAEKLTPRETTPFVIPGSPGAGRDARARPATPEAGVLPISAVRMNGWISGI
jgi:hypothetical protein